MTSFVTSIASHASRFEGILKSENETAELIRDFRRQNELIAELYEKRISGYLARRGWFVAGTLVPNQYLKLGQAIEQGAEAQIESFMIRHIRSITDEIASKAYATWPHRKAILSDAFDAHPKKRFTLSIPVMLAQADGMALEILGAFLFSNQSGNIATRTEEIIDEDITQRPLARSFLGLLIQASGLRLSTNKRDQRRIVGDPFSPLNRHGVLHGIDCSYFEDFNSLRAIALIDYLNWIHEMRSKEEVT